MIYLDVVADELHKAVYKFTSLHSPLLFSTRSAFHSIAAAPTVRITRLTNCRALLDWTFKVDLMHPVSEKNCVSDCVSPCWLFWTRSRSVDAEDVTWAREERANFEINSTVFFCSTTWSYWDTVSLSDPIYSAQTHYNSLTHYRLTGVTSANLTPWTWSLSENWVLSQECAGVHHQFPSFLLLLLPLIFLFFLFLLLLMYILSIFLLLSVSPLSLCFFSACSPHFFVVATYLAWHVQYFPLPTLFLSLSLTPLISPSFFLSFSSTAPARWHFTLTLIPSSVCVCVCVCVWVCVCLLCHSAMQLDCDSRYHQIPLKKCVMQEAKGACFYMFVCMCVSLCVCCSIHA